MDISKLTRDADAIKRAIHHDKKGSVAVAKEPLKIYMPKRWLEGAMASLDDKLNTLCCLGVVVGDKWAKLEANTIIELLPHNVNELTIEGEVYFELSYEAGDIISPNTNAVVKDQLVYHVYYNFESMGKTPWYVKHTDLPQIYDTSEYHAGVSLHANHAILEAFSASRMRDPNDLTKYFRYSINSQEEYLNKVAAIIPLNSVELGADTTISKLIGSNLEEGIQSAMSTETQTAEDMDLLLRA